MRSINGYGKTIAFMLTVMLPAPSLAADSPVTGKVTKAIAVPLQTGPAAGAPILATAPQNPRATIELRDV
jgi:hypothetical protein